jgi:hypothetical protein
MISDTKLDEFVRRACEAAGENLESVILYGSAVAGDYHPEFSNLNLFCVLRETSFTALQSLAPVAHWWEKQKQPPPLIMTRHELARSNDVFTIELLDMQQHHSVLFGDDALLGLHIPVDLHRVQVEYELREKLILLRQQMLLSSGDNRRLWQLLLRSVSSFATLFRHALIVLGQVAPVAKRDAVLALAQFLQVDASAICQVLDVREHKANPKSMDVNDIFSRYLSVVEQVTAAVDEALGADAPTAS